jgi:signal peptidase II
MINLLWIFIIIICYAIDRITKALIIANIEYSSPLAVIKDFFLIVHSENAGAAWGIFQNGRYYFIAATIIVLMILIYILYKYAPHVNKTLGISLSVIIGGSAGNLKDRITSGKVIDFLDFHLGSYHFPTFNFADMCLVCGTILLSIYLLFIHKDKNKKEKIEICGKNNEE